MTVVLSDKERTRPGRIPASALPYAFFFASMLLYALCLYNPKLFVAFTKVPDWLSLPVSAMLNGVVGWVATAFKWLFRPLANFADWQIKVVDSGLSTVPWPVVTVAAALAVWRVTNLKLAVLTVATGIYITSMGYWAESMKTITLVLFALPSACLLGFLIGFLAHSWRPAAWVVDLLLSFVQTVPAFAYLVPLIVLFGFGPVPGVIASLLYALPPTARNVQLGLDSVPKSIIESAIVSGCTRSQVFFFVKLPAARRQLLIGLNQTIMACLSMVIFAAAIGGFEDIGWEVLRAARKAEFGNGFISGSIVTLLAILLDRITSYDHTSQTACRRLSNSAFLTLFFVVVVATWVVCGWQDPSGLGKGLRPSFAAWLDASVVAMTVALEPVTTAVSAVVTYGLLLPLRAGIARTIPSGLFGPDSAAIFAGLYSCVLVVAAMISHRAWRLGPEVAAAFALLYTGFLTVPWLPFVGLLSLVAYRVGGWRSALKVFAILLFFAVSGVWTSTMFALYLSIAAMLACVVIGGGLGVLASQFIAVSRIMRPVNDFLQTIPPFVILIPVIIFFGVGDLASFVAIVAYSVAAMARYTEHGLRSVPASLVEAGKMAGCRPFQLLLLVQLPAAARQIVLGISQTYMYCLAMLAVAALVGARGLGQDVYIALGKADAGLGILAGGCIALMAIGMNEMLNKAYQNPANLQSG